MFCVHRVSHERLKLKSSKLMVRCSVVFDLGVKIPVSRVADPSRKKKKRHGLLEHHSASSEYCESVRGTVTAKVSEVQASAYEKV